MNETIEFELTQRVESFSLDTLEYDVCRSLIAYYNGDYVNLVDFVKELKSRL